MIYGIDASNHQGNMDGLNGFDATFFVHKLTEGTGYVDMRAAHNLAMVRAHKIPVLGGYHYIRAGNGVGQADYFADRARQLFGHDLRGFLWQLDCEADASYADVKAFKQRWDKGTGAPILFYTGDWWLKPRGWNVARLGFAGLWSAPNRGYVGKAANVRSGDWHAGYGGFDRITICQYDARQSIGDTNQFAGSLAQLRALLGSREDDMPSVKDVWNTDGLIPAPHDSASYRTNKSWTPGNSLAEAVRASRANETRLAALTVAVKELATATGKDPERVYAAIESGSKQAVAEALAAGAQG